MKKRFEGANGRDLLVEALRRQPISSGHKDIAETLADASDIQEFKVGESLIKQDATDNCIFFILSGTVTVEINGRVIADRKATQHVGEMALIDPGARRSASVIARSDTVCAKVSEPVLTTIADANPRVWRNLAVELGNRLRERSKHVKCKNVRPQIFIGSSREALNEAKSIESRFVGFNADVTTWSEGVFKASFTTIETLETKAKEVDFAILILSADDVAKIRGKDELVPRDNVIFELGLFMGAIGRERTFMIVPTGSDVKLPTDLLGVTVLRSDATAKSLDKIISELAETIGKRGPK